LIDEDSVALNTRLSNIARRIWYIPLFITNDSNKEDRGRNELHYEHANTGRAAKGTNDTQACLRKRLRKSRGAGTENKQLQRYIDAILKPERIQDFANVSKGDFQSSLQIQIQYRYENKNAK